jgi:hypothetical protein
MSERHVDRRTFLVTGARTGLAVCGACLCGFPTFADDTSAKGEAIDPAKREYCGYVCPDDCKLLRATLADDLEGKKDAWGEWKLEERFGVAFDPKQAFCFRCKSPGKPEGFVVSHCDVRSCVREKKLECCIECAELPGCEKDLWRRFPDFKAQVVALRKRYLAQT